MHGSAPLYSLFLSLLLGLSGCDAQLCDLDGDGLCPPTDCNDAVAALHTNCPTPTSALPSPTASASPSASSPTSPPTPTAPSHSPAPTGDIHLKDGAWGHVITHGGPDESLGSALHALGDLDGDGYDDLLIGAYRYKDASGDHVGAAYLLYGPLDGETDLTQLGETVRGHRFLGTQQEGCVGTSLGSMDVNGDGEIDLLIGEPGILQVEAPFSFTGAAHIVFGPLPPATLGEGANPDIPLDSPDISFVSDRTNDWTGFAISRAGDLDGDGHQDLMISAPVREADDGLGISAFGSIFLFYGPLMGESGMTRTLGPEDADAILLGEANQGSAGVHITAGGDLSQDGIDDVLIGSMPLLLCDEEDEGPGQTACDTLLINDETLPGTTYLLQGQDGQRLSGEIHLSEVGTPALPGTRFTGLEGKMGATQKGDQSGRAAASVGDLDHDGYPDLLIGAETHSVSDNEVGGAYFSYGPFPPGDVSLPDQHPSEGAFLNGTTPCGHLGRHLSPAGDLDQDGLLDLIIAAPHHDDDGCETDSPLEEAGAVYILYGTRNEEGQPRRFSDGQLSPGQGGETQATFLGPARFTSIGYGTLAAGDLNGDGYDDVLFTSLSGRGENLADFVDWDGTLYVVRGGPRRP